MSCFGRSRNQWAFCPSIPGAIIGLTCFSIITVAHFSQAVIYRKWFCWIICMAVSWETASFALRVLGTKDPRNELYSMLSQILVILAPLWINAFAYMVMGRLIYYWLPTKSLWGVKARMMTKVFVWLDIGIFMIQLVGGVMLDSDEAPQVKLGMKIYMSGIGVQQAFVVMFCILAIRFHYEAHHCGIFRPTSWKPPLYVLYSVMVLITIRIIYRLLEFSSGVDGYIPSHEGFFYALEATPMILATAIFAIVHPGRSLTEPQGEFAKMIVQKGDRRWWCLGRRSRTRIGPDFQIEEGSGIRIGGENLPLPRYKVDTTDDGTQTRRHHIRLHSHKQSGRHELQIPFESV